MKYQVCFDIFGEEFDQNPSAFNNPLNDVFNVTQDNDKIFHVKSDFLGRHGEVYSIDVDIFVQNKDNLTIVSSCSCPMHNHCKHVSATLYAVMASHVENRGDKNNLLKTHLHPVDQTIPDKGQKTALSLEEDKISDQMLINIFQWLKGIDNQVKSKVAGALVTKPWIISLF